MKVMIIPKFIEKTTEFKTVWDKKPVSRALLLVVGDLFEYGQRPIKLFE